MAYLLDMHYVLTCHALIAHHRTPYLELPRFLRGHLHHVRFDLENEDEANDQEKGKGNKGNARAQE